MMTTIGLESLRPENVTPLMSSLSEPSISGHISWVPNAPGWYWLLFLLFCFALYRIYLFVQNYLSNTYRRAALIELEHFTLQEPLSEKEQYQKLPQLLRRTALYAFPRSDIAPLTGIAWEKWLDDHCTKSQFSTEISGLLSQLAYSPRATLTEENKHAILDNVALWIKHHEVSHD